MLFDPPRLPIFVYGTLRPGQKNYLLFLGGKTVREEPATIEGRLFYIADGGYPFVLPGGGKVAGDLVELDPETYTQTLRRLDELEEYDPQDEKNSVYLRRPGTATLAGGKRVTAWIYYWNRSEIVGAIIESGDFRDRSEG